MMNHTSSLQVALSRAIARGDMKQADAIRDIGEHIESLRAIVVERADNLWRFPVRLSPNERTILAALFMRASISKESIFVLLYGHRTPADQPRSGKTIDVFICTLRRKLAAGGVPDAIGSWSGDVSTFYTLSAEHKAAIIGKFSIEATQ